jgi:hypothetical protein
VGGNDELIFDGRSLVCDAQGRVVAGLAAFAEDHAVVEVKNLGTAAPFEAPRLHPSFAQDEYSDMFEALVLGLRDYAHKSGFKRALIALSGGIDSAVVGVIAAAAFGPENVTGECPSRPRFRPSIPATTRASSPRISGSILKRSRSRTRWPPVRLHCRRCSPGCRATSPRRISRPACAAC